MKLAFTGTFPFHTPGRVVRSIGGSAQQEVKGPGSTVHPSQSTGSIQGQHWPGTALGLSPDGRGGYWLHQHPRPLEPYLAKLTPCSRQGLFQAWCCPVPGLELHPPPQMLSGFPAGCPLVPTSTSLLASRSRVP